MNKSEVLALKNKYSKQISTLESKTREGIDMAEISAGAAGAGYLDVKFPTIAGVPTSAAVGIALYVGGQVSGQRDVAMLGVGFVAGTAYQQGAKLAGKVSETVTENAKKVVNG